jgi:hypothetical protein
VSERQSNVQASKRARAWQRTKQYVAGNSATRIGDATDTTIRTVEPQELC